jgi:RHS repeat-associated protein
VLHDSSNNTLNTPGVSQQVGGQDQFFHTDWLGSTRDLTDTTGNTLLAWQRYDAFGQRTVQAGPNFPSEFLFAGDWGYQNEYNSPTEPGVGLQYLQNRYYDPAIGRFIGPDRNEAPDPPAPTSGLQSSPRCGRGRLRGPGRDARGCLR